MAKVDIRRTELNDGTMHYTVHVVGLNPTAGTGDPNNLANSISAAYGHETDVEIAVREAMRQAGIGPNDPVMLVGHSLGGLTVANLAENDEFQSSYRIDSVVAIGATIHNRDIEPPTRVLQITNPNDDVVTLTSIAGGENRMRGRSNYTEHEVPFGLPFIPFTSGTPLGLLAGLGVNFARIMQNHPLDKYGSRLADWDQTDDKGTAWRENNAPFLCGPHVKSSELIEYDVTTD